MAKLKDWSSFHSRNIIREDAGVFNKLTAGQIVRFNYTGKTSTVKRPLVLILHPRFRGKMHAISLDNISDAILLKLREIVQETTQQRIAKLTRLRLPLLKSDIKDPQRFYDNRLKPFIRTFFNSDQSPYRTYLIGGMTNLRVIDYRFKDMNVSSTGEEDTVRGKTRER